MTSEQESQFLLYGCGSRCLIKLSELQQRPIDRPSFIDRFATKYPAWGQQCGITNTSALIDIARELGLCSSADTRVHKDFVRELTIAKRTRGVLVITDQLPNAEGHQRMFHCRLLCGFRQDNWILWQPNQDGQEFQMLISPAELDQQLAHFLIFN